MAGTPAKSIDGLNPVKPANPVSEPTASGTSPPSLFSAASENHTFLSSRSGVVPESGRFATGPYRNDLPQSWEPELEHPTVAPADLQANREHPISYPRAQSANPAAAALPRPHPDLVERSQQTLRILTSPVHLASPFRHGTSSSSAGTADAVQSINSRGPHTSPSPGPLQARYAHLNLVSEPLGTAYTESGRTQRDLGPEAEAARRTQVDLSIPDLVAPQLGPSSAPLPSIYWFLFDLDHDSVDQQQDDVSRSSSRPLLGMGAPHVTPTPVSFLAKWEDMLALERQIRSSSHNTKLVQSKQAQAVRSVEADRTKQGRRGEVALTGTGKRGLLCCPQNFFFHM
jgi:hypothetical protein